MKPINLNALIFALILSGAALYKSRFQSEERTLKSNPQADTLDAQNVTEALDSTTPVVVPIRQVATAKVGPEGAVEAKFKAKTLPHTQELERYATLRSKVFLDETEESQKEQLLRNPAVLRSLGQRLLRSASDDAAALEQNNAIEMLLDALRSGDGPVATEVLKAVVEDGQVENADLDLASRENLAGIKAEVLYQWSAIRPVQSAQLVTWLPGPVSQRIWTNVVNLQASNLAESADAD